MTTRIQIIPEQFAAEAAAQSQGTIGVDTSAQQDAASRVLTGAVSLTAGGDAVQHGATRYIHSSEGREGGSVLATLSRAGTSQTVELVPGVPGSRTTVALALREGVLVRDSAGNLQDAKTAAGQQHTLETKAEEHLLANERQQQDQQQGFGTDAWSAEDDQLWAQDIDPLPQQSYDSAVASAIGSIVHGSVGLDQTAQALARSAGIDPEMATDYVQQGVAMYERTVARAVSQLGIEGERLEQFYEHVRGQPEKLQDAIQRMVHMRDMSAWKDLAVTFKVRNPGDLTAYHSVGFETHVDRDTGEVMLRRGTGRWIAASELVKSAR
ncbi:hypothetical protein [Caldimonas sp. KR1-144]|uniref:hypothetical protein n=1 Tax=Caldimonas sp. KR1-144 TaxID=3400911 RepID=UPI003C0C1E95